MYTSRSFTNFDLMWTLWACAIQNGGGVDHTHNTNPILFNIAKGEAKVTSWLPKSLPLVLWRLLVLLEEPPPLAFWQLQWEKAPEDPRPIALTSAKKCTSIKLLHLFGISHAIIKPRSAGFYDVYMRVHSTCKLAKSTCTKTKSTKLLNIERTRRRGCLLLNCPA
jgi:hypothetical protein